jgi:hypothetical protein
MSEYMSVWMSVRMRMIAVSLTCNGDDGDGDNKTGRIVCLKAVSKKGSRMSHKSPSSRRWW